MRRTLWALSTLLLTLGCQAGSPSGGGAARKPRQDTDTRLMARMLEETAQRFDHAGNPVASHARVERAEQRVASTTGLGQIQLRYALAYELLNAGQTERAIGELETVAKVIAQHPGQIPPQIVRQMEELSAIAHLRLGEQQNCLLRHTADSCLFPISGGGVHQLQDGSRAAMKQLETLLASDPDDLSSRWLLNVAAMTLGKYPEGVAERWRIPPQAFRSQAPMPRFPDIAPALGLDVTGLSGGSVMEDFDGDGYLDVMASSWGVRDQLRYFRNQADGSFAERTEEAGLSGLIGGLNLVHADYDNDGDADVLVLRGAWAAADGHHPNSLLRNNGDGTFADVTRRAGLLSFHPTQTAAWGDFNNDGWLDLYIGNETLGHEVHASELYVNLGRGGDGRVRFEEIAGQAGVAVQAYVKGVVWGDVDNDGRLDLYVSCLSGPNRLLHNDGPDATGRYRFTDIARQAGVTEPHFSFPVWFWDFDNDGWLDLFASGYSLDRFGKMAADVAADYLGLPSPAETPRLYRNNHDGTFADITGAAGLSQALFTMGSNYGDLDNDGWLDMYLGTGEPDYRAIVPNRMFLGDAGQRFLDVTTAGGFGHLQKGHGVAFGDLDNDGDQDIYAVIGGALDGDVYQNVLFENPGSGRRWITLMLEGVRSPRCALGARIVLTVATPAGERRIHITVSTGGSFGSSSLRQEIGLGDATALRSIEITWPRDGEKQVLTGVAMDQIIKVVEGRDGFEPVALETLRFAAGTSHAHP